MTGVRNIFSYSGGDCENILSGTTFFAFLCANYFFEKFCKEKCLHAF